MKSIRVIGAGFSGLTVAYELAKAGHDVEVCESQPDVGGLIRTLQTPFGPVETAANGILANADVEEFFIELGLKLARRGPERKRRYIYWNGRPRRWPISIPSTVRILGWALNRKRNPDLYPRSEETVQAWCERVLDADIAERLMAPALRGIYAGDPKRMSAKLTLGRLFSHASAKKGVIRGTVSLEGGMGAIFMALRHRLEEMGVVIRQTEIQKLESDRVQIVATNAWAAARILGDTHPKVAQILSRCESLPLISATLFFAKTGREIKGFGCLFPEAEKFHATGVLFNDCIFPDRFKDRSETWILGGPDHESLLDLSDQDLLVKILQDRRRLMQAEDRPIGSSIARWPRAIPHYTVEWERALRELRDPRPIYLHGNYLGGIGLAQILARSKRLANEIGAELGQ